MTLLESETNLGEFAVKRFLKTLTEKNFLTISSCKECLLYYYWFPQHYTENKQYRVAQIYKGYFNKPVMFSWSLLLAGKSCSIR